MSESAFEGCTNLESVSFPEAETIGNNVFDGCGKLASITISEGCSIGYAQGTGSRFYDFSGYYLTESSAGGTYTYSGSKWNGPE